MPRWYALNLAARPVGPMFEARDATDAYDRGCALYGSACVTVQSSVSWEVTEAERRTAERQRGRRREPW